MGRFRTSYAQMRCALFGLVLAMVRISEEAGINMLVYQTSRDEDGLLVFDLTSSDVLADVDVEAFEEALRLVPARKFCDEAWGER